MVIEVTNDMDLVAKILKHPKVFPFCGDDFGPSREDFVPVRDPYVLYVSISDLGVFIFGLSNPICWEVHMAFLPELWGKAGEVARIMAHWVFNNYEHVQRIVAYIPSDNRLAVQVADAAGMTRFGINECSVMRRGRLIDQELFGISRDQLCHL